MPEGYKNITWNYLEYMDVSSTSKESIFRNAARSLHFVVYNYLADEIILRKTNNEFFSIEYLYFTPVLNLSHNITFTRVKAGYESTTVWVDPPPISVQYKCNTDCVNINALKIKLEYDKSKHLNVKTIPFIIMDDFCIST